MKNSFWIFVLSFLALQAVPFLILALHKSEAVPYIIVYEKVTPNLLADCITDENCMDVLTLEDMKK